MMMIMARPVVVMSNEVIEALGGPSAAHGVLDRRPGPFTCLACRRAGFFGRDPVVAFTFSFNDGAGPAVAGLMHAGCGESRVIPVPGLPPPAGRSAGLPVLTWLRPHGCQPPAMLLIGPLMVTFMQTPGGDLVDKMLSVRLAEGFTLMTGMDDPVPVLDGLLARRQGEDIAVRWDGKPVGSIFDGSVGAPPPAWERAVRTGVVGVVWAAGLRLDNPERDDLADLSAAMGRGTVAGAAATITPADSPPDMPPDTWSYALPARRRPGPGSRPGGRRDRRR
jgi:hypothetical protein